MTKPLTDVRVRLAGEDGNAFFIVAKVQKALKRAGHNELAKRYMEEAFGGNYDHLLQVTMKYVEVY